MTALVRHEDGKEFNWNAALKGNEEEGFQWAISLHRIVDEENNHIIYEVTNRGWRTVGPEFKTRTEGSKFLGFSGGRENVSKNWDRLIEEYHGLFSDEIETYQQFHSENKPKFGRPSQGRTERMQFSATPELRKWLESQVKPGENVSLVTFRLLEEIRKSSVKHRPVERPDEEWLDYLADHE